MDTSHLNDQIKKIHQEQTRQEKTASCAGNPSSDNKTLAVRENPEMGLAAYEPMRLESAAEARPAGVIGRALLSFQRISDDMQRERAVRGAQQAVLGHQIDAIKRESCAYWRAKSAELTEVMDTYLQEHLLALESDRLDNRVKALEMAASTITTRMQSIDAADYPDVVKEDLLASAYRQYRETCERIQKEVLVEKYTAS